MTKMKRPGVYIIEKNAFPNSVVEVATAVPAFIGYTQKAENGSQSLLNVPFRISSLSEYELYFGGAADKNYTLSLVGDNAEVVDLKKKISTANGTAKEVLEVQLAALIHNLTDLVLGNEACMLTLTGNLFTFYEHIKLFFANGGGTCYIVSVGDYTKKVEKANFENGINMLEREQDPTIVVIPEAVNGESYFDVYKKMLQHCGTMKNRFAILDIPEGYKGRKSGAVDIVESFRAGVGSGYLNFASAYYPWLHTSVTGLSDIGKANLSNDKSSLLSLIYKTKSWGNDKELAHIVRCFELNDEFKQIQNNSELETEEKKTAAKQEVAKRIVGEDPIASAYLKEISGVAAPTPENYLTAATEKLPVLQNGKDELIVAKWWKQKEIDKSITTTIGKKMNLLPPSAAMAGLYTQVDNSRGVWKAPANVSLNYVVAPAVEITDSEQEDLNMTDNGKSVNAIRSFIGSGIKVWGARTLDGNNLNWSYINVRRTMIFLESSIKNAAQSYVFEPNDANIWLNMKCMIENFLRGIWKRGGLVGASPEEAYSVHVGLGETMTPEDILEGIMRITVLVAISHPAEFVEITFQQQLQKS